MPVPPSYEPRERRRQLRPPGLYLALAGVALLAILGGWVRAADPPTALVVAGLAVAVTLLIVAERRRG